MAEQYTEITWSFNLEDRGTHSGNYFDKLNQLVSGFNNLIAGVNAQLVASEDATSMRDEVISLRDNDITSLLNQVVALRDETIAIRDATNTIAVGDINGISVDFLSAKVNGVDVVLASRKINDKSLSSDINLSKSDVGLNNVDNTSDADKPISNATQAALNELEILAMAGAMR